MQSNPTNKIPPNTTNLKDFINMERYFSKKPSIFNKYYQTNLLQIIDLLPPCTQQQKEKYFMRSQNVTMKKKSAKPISQNDKTKQQSQEAMYNELIKNTVAGTRHTTDRMNQDSEINQFQFCGLLGRGAHSVVKLCRFIGQGRQVGMNGKQLYVRACKILWFEKIRKKYFIKQNELIQMVLTQITLLSQLSHPNIAKLHQAIYLKQKQRLFLIMQHAPNGPITKLMNNNLTMDDHKWYIIVKKYFKQVVSAISYLHSQNIIHRDLKLENILIGDNDQVKLIDFNVSLRLKDSSEKVKITNKFVGTKAYAAPQLILNLEKQKYCCGKSLDIWALGICLIELLQRRHPYPVKTLPQLIKLLQNYELQCLCKSNPTQKILKTLQQQNQLLNYRLIINQDYPQELRKMLQGMLQFQNSKRITIEEVEKSQWLKGE